MWGHELSVTTAADDISLLTAEELRDAAGVADDSQDSKLAIVGRQIAAMICAECCVAIGSGSGEATLRQETLTETYRNVCARELILSRRHNIEMVGVNIDESSVDLSSVVVNPESALIERVVNGSVMNWHGREIVVVYKAGFNEVPEHLKSVAADALRWRLSMTSRDPLVKSQNIEVVGVDSVRTDLWVGGLPGQDAGAGGLPGYIAAQLARYRNGVAQ
jgi:hypothetical protein